MSINEIIYEALTLKPKERYMIIDILISSLSQWSVNPHGIHL